MKSTLSIQPSAFSNRHCNHQSSFAIAPLNRQSAMSNRQSAVGNQQLLMCAAEADAGGHRYRQTETERVGQRAAHAAIVIHGPARGANSAKQLLGFLVACILHSGGAQEGSVHQINHIFVAAALAAAVAGAGCKRTITEKEAAPDTQVGRAQQTAITTTITGCLRAGNADGTFVLNEAQSAGGNQAATYQLVAANADDLRAHLNQRVQVVGTIQSDQQV